METEEKKEKVSVYPKELLTYEEAGEIIGVGPRTIQNYVSYGWLRVVTFTSRTKRIRRCVIDAFIQLAASGQLPPPKEPSQLFLRM